MWYSCNVVQLRCGTAAMSGIKWDQQNWNQLSVQTSYFEAQFVLNDWWRVSLHMEGLIAHGGSHCMRRVSLHMEGLIACVGSHCIWRVSLHMESLIAYGVSHCTWRVSLHMEGLIAHGESHCIQHASNQPHTLTGSSAELTVMCATAGQCRNLTNQPCCVVPR
jgi:hypothetical protein